MHTGDRSGPLMARILTASTIDGNVASPLHGPTMGRPLSCFKDAS
jgi:hypothetical protein